MQQPIILFGNDVTAQVIAAQSMWFDPQLENWELDLKAVLPGLQPEIRDAGTTFLENVRNAWNTVSLPFNTLFGHALMELRENAERSGDQDLITKIANLDQSDARVVDYLNTGRIMAWVRAYTLGRHRAIGLTHQDVLLQGAVLLWGCFEAFVADNFIAALKANPRLDAKAQATPTIIQASANKIDLADLANWTTNREDIHFNQLKAMKRAYSALLDAPRGAAAETALSNNDLNILMERRHKIVHKAGIVDQLYITKTGDHTFAIGQRISLTPQNISEAVKLIRDTAIKLLQRTDEEVRIP